MVTKIIGLSADFLSHPGETLKEVLEHENMTQIELSIRTGLDKKTISQIINGTAPITYETALRLEKIFNLKASFWNALQSNYKDELLRIKEIDSVTADELNLLNQIPYKNLISIGYIKKQKDQKSLILTLREFFRINNLVNLLDAYKLNAVYRKVSANENPFAIATWLRMCEIETDAKLDKKFDKEKLISNLDNIKSLNLKEINYSISRLKEIFNDCGVSFNVVHNVPGAPVQGSIFSSKKTLRLCLTIRQKYADVFWFSLFHEIGHLLNLKNNNTFIDFENGKISEEEDRADSFASKILLNQNEYSKFTRTKFYKEDIIKFANKNGVLPCIVVGRLHHDNIIPYSYYNDLRIRYEWERKST